MKVKTPTTPRSNNFRGIKAPTSVPQSSQKTGFCKLNLTHVNGITSKNNSSIDYNLVNSNLAYITGSIVVIYDTKMRKQMHFLMNKNS